MGSMRAMVAQSSIDRELHRHLGRAAHFTQAALTVCGRAARGKSRNDASAYREQQRRLELALNLVASIGLVGGNDTNEMRDEARALCSWLAGRERVAGLRVKSRRGSEYQARLNQVLGFLRAVRNPDIKESESKARFVPTSEPGQSIYAPTGVIYGPG